MEYDGVGSGLRRRVEGTDNGEKKRTREVKRRRSLK